MVTFSSTAVEIIINNPIVYMPSFASHREILIHNVAIWWGDGFCRICVALRLCGMIITSHLPFSRGVQCDECVTP
eukprot:9147343-Pyramimonas_sp.AAC.2